MEQNKPTGLKYRKITPLGDLVQHIKLVFGLIGDGRVNLLLKIVPIFGFIYLIWPLDLSAMLPIPIISAIDDIGILWFTQYLFIELCPPDVVEDVRRSLTAPLTNSQASAEDHGDVIEAEVREIK